MKLQAISAGDSVASRQSIEPPCRYGEDVVVALIDARPFSRECFGRWIETSVGGFHVLGYGDAGELPDAGAWPNPPNLVVLSVGFAAVGAPPVADAIELLHGVLPSTPLVILSDRDEVTDVVDAMRRGVQGFVPTTLDVNQMVEALRFVAVGGTFVPAEAFLRQSVAAAPQPNGAEEEGGCATEEPLFDRLTPRQREVLDLLRLGKSNKIIAHELGMKESTVKVHIRNIMNKFHATNRTEAACRAHQLRQRFADEDLIRDARLAAKADGPI